MLEKTRYASKSWGQIRREAVERDINQIFKPVQPSMPNVKRSAVLIRFRKFIEGEKLSTDLITEFLGSFPSWWLLTTDEAERLHARDVLERLWQVVDEAENGDLYNMNRED
jgi:hypothetical protein